jgi:hypothetical protein
LVELLAEDGFAVDCRNLIKTARPQLWPVSPAAAVRCAAASPAGLLLHVCVCIDDWPLWSTSAGHSTTEWWLGQARDDGACAVPTGAAYGPCCDGPGGAGVALIPVRFRGGPAKDVASLRRAVLSAFAATNAHENNFVGLAWAKSNV